MERTCSSLRWSLGSSYEEHEVSSEKRRCHTKFTFEEFTTLLTSVSIVAPLWGPMLLLRAGMLIFTTEKLTSVLYSAELPGHCGGVSSVAWARKGEYLRSCESARFARTDCARAPHARHALEYQKALASGRRRLCRVIAHARLRYALRSKCLHAA